MQSALLSTIFPGEILQSFAKLCRSRRSQHSMYCSLHVSFVFPLIVTGQKLRHSGHDGRLQSHSASATTLSPLLNPTFPLCCTSPAAWHSSLSQPVTSQLQMWAPLYSIESYQKKGDDNQLYP